MSVYKRMNWDLIFVLWTEIESYKQGYEYNNSHSDVCFEIPIGHSDYEDGTAHETRSALDTASDTQTCREGNIHARQKLIETGKQRKSMREGHRRYYL